MYLLELRFANALYALRNTLCAMHFKTVFLCEFFVSPWELSNLEKFWRIYSANIFLVVEFPQRHKGDTKTPRSGFYFGNFRKSEIIVYSGAVGTKYW